jgi:hypothetical protein
MRFVVVAALFCGLMVGLGYTYSQERSVPTFLTAAVERGSISTLVKASGASMSARNCRGELRTCSLISTTP